MNARLQMKLLRARQRREASDPGRYVYPLIAGTLLVLIGLAAL